MATEYIKREDALDAWYDNERFTDIEAIPAADVVEQKHGQWIKSDDGFDESWVCSECMEEYVSVDADFIDYAHYCPNCGAAMDGEA